MPSDRIPSNVTRLSVAIMVNLRRYSLIAGLPIGLVIALLTLLSSDQGWWFFLLTITLATAAIAVVLGVLVEGFVHLVRRSAISALLLVVLTVGATVLSGVSLHLGALRLVPSRWIRLPDLPQVAQAFVGPECGWFGDDDWNVFLTARDGGYLAYHRGTGQSGTWTAESEIPVRILDRECRPGDEDRRTRSVPEDVIAAFRVEERGSDCYASVRYRLKADNSVWESSTAGCALIQLPAYLIFGGALILIGLIVGLGRLSPTVDPPWVRPPQGSATQ